MNKRKWIADIRVGLATVHIEDKERFNCLDGMRDECIYYAHGIIGKDGWEVSPEIEANANLIAAAPDMYEALKLYQSHQQGTSGHYCWECAEAINDAVAKVEGKGEKCTK